MNTLISHELLFPHTASACAAVRSSPGRLSADPGRRQSPCPGTQPPLAQGRCPEGQPWAPLAAHTPSHPAAVHGGSRHADMPCPSDSAGGSPAPKQHLFLYKGKTVRVLLTDPIGSGMCQLEEIIAGTTAALSCSQRLIQLKAVEIFLQLISTLSSHLTQLPLNSFLLPSTSLATHSQAVPSALLGFKEELLLGTAVSLQHLP